MGGLVVTPSLLYVATYHQSLFLLPLDCQVPSSSSPPSLAPAIMADALKSSTLLLDQRPLSTSGAAATTAESLLPIVSSQRERFKQRNAELEAVSGPVLHHPHSSLYLYVIVYSGTVFTAPSLICIVCSGTHYNDLILCLFVHELICQLCMKSYLTFRDNGMSWEVLD